MSNRSLILNTLKTDLLKITAVGGYQTTVNRVEHGIFYPEDFVERPVIWFYNTDIKTVKQTFDRGGIRELSIVITLLTKFGREDPNDLDDLITDVLIFLNSEDNTYVKNTKIGDIKVYEGPPSDPISLAEIQVFIQYTFSKENP